MYEFNPLTPLDILPMPNIFTFKHKGVQAKVDYVKKLHKRAQIEKKKGNYAKQANERRKKLFLNPVIRFGFI